MMQQREISPPQTNNAHHAYQGFPNSNDITKEYSTSDFGGLYHPNQTAKFQPNPLGSIENPKSNKMLKTAYGRSRGGKRPTGSNGGSSSVGMIPIPQPFPVKVTNLNQMVQIKRKRPKLKYQDKLIHQAQQERRIYSQQVQFRENKRVTNKILDGFLLLYSCRVKLPHEAIRSKLSGENIVDVREEDMMYFKQNL